MKKTTKDRLDKKLTTITQKLTDLLAEVDRLEESEERKEDRETLNEMGYRLSSVIQYLNIYKQEI